jgi:signal-transduction protein with cAMP-binding, CBS, and nucleotidyltransferase domain
MVRCVPYFSKLSDDIILEIIYLLKSEKFNQDNKIIKRGDNIQRLCFVFEGIVEVTIPFLDKDLFFDNLNPGSNFSVFSCFNEESQSIVNFSAKTSCIINFIEVEDLFTLSKLHIDLKDIIKKIYIEQINLTKTDFDFFRFNPDMMFADKVKKSKSKAYVSKMKLNMAKR